MIDEASSQQNTQRLDFYAGGLATLCLLHCLALPVLIAALPLSLALVDSHWLHQVIVVLAAPATLWVVARGQPGPLFTWVALSGLVLLVVAAFVEPAEPYEEPLTVLGSILLASAHGWNWWRGERTSAAAVVPANTHEQLSEPK